MAEKIENIYYPMPAKVTEIIDETSTIKTYRFQMEKPFTFRAGQFVQLTIPGVGEAPFTPSSKPGTSPELEITILGAGKVTNKLHKDTKVGDMLGIRGPFGKGYPMEKMKGHEILVVGGGVGLAPLRAGLYSLFENIDDYKRVSIKYGSKTPNDLVFKYQHEQWAKMPKTDVKLTIDKPYRGWSGTVGVVTVLLDKENGFDMNIDDCYVIICGPEIMLKFVTYKLLDIGFAPEKIYLSMNRRMSCGVGMCHRCNIGPYYLCKDGPDMCYAKIKDYPNVFS
ncbi:FAD/NAD(P)-binding protein [bacterium]|nr:FAD/NAD(P)-binding protein [bacterium]